MSFEREEIFYNALSNNMEQLENKFEKMKVVDEETKSKEELVVYTTKRKKMQS